MGNRTIELSLSLSEQQIKDLLRFHETTEDDQGYDVPLDRMKSLARAGLIRSLGFRRYEFTDVGMHAVESLQADPDGPSLDERMKAANLIPVSQMLARGPLDGILKHAGVNDLETFRQWVEMKRAEYLKMQARYDLKEKSEDDELYEWVLAHSAVFTLVHINLKAALASPVAQEKPESLH
jgi:hypothetical protein